MSPQVQNDELQSIMRPDLFGNGFEHLHEPLGDFGVFSGQFEQGPDDAPEGWEVNLYAGGTCARTTGGLAGNWCMYDGQAGMGRGGWIESLHYIPVDENREYYLSAAFKGSHADASVYLGVACYTAAKVFIAYAYPLAPYLPGVAWVRRQVRVGPLGDVVLAANTRYVRVVVALQYDQTLTGRYAYVDDVQFQQLKATYSPLITYTDGQIVDYTASTFSKQSYTAWPNTTITLTFEEKGYFWLHYLGTLSNSAARATAWRIAVFVDGAGTNLGIRGCSPVANYLTPWCISGRSIASYARGAHTVDVRVWVETAGDTATAYNVIGSAYYVRRW